MSAENISPNFLRSKSRISYIVK